MMLTIPPLITGINPALSGAPALTALIVCLTGPYIFGFLPYRDYETLKSRN
jgi:hypothetical protein